MNFSKARYNFTRRAVLRRALIDVFENFQAMYILVLENLDTLATTYRWILNSVHEVIFFTSKVTTFTFTSKRSVHMSSKKKFQWPRVATGIPIREGCPAYINFISPSCLLSGIGVDTHWKHQLVKTCLPLQSSIDTKMQRKCGSYVLLMSGFGSPIQSHLYAVLSDSELPEIHFWIDRWKEPSLFAIRSACNFTSQRNGGAV